MKWDAKKLRRLIDQRLPPGKVITRHTETGHFYEIDKKVYPSVTGKLQIIKDESLINYKMNRAVEYVFANWKQFTDANVMEHLDKASRVSADILSDAGDIGRDVHDYREKYFLDWITVGHRPNTPILNYIPPEKEDIRAVSALRALEKFIDDYGYEPVKTEMYVYSHELKVAGTLDDLGLVWTEKRPGDKDCIHDWLIDKDKGIKRCLKCDAKYVRQFALMDIKTSNQFKDHYFFQVALYYWMFKQITGLRPERCFIVKLSKQDGSYKVEDLYRHAILASYARSMVRTHTGIEFIKELRKDNQRIVAPVMEI